MPPGREKDRPDDGDDSPEEIRATAGAGRGLRMLRPLAIRDFRLLWTGMTVSLFGDGIYFVAIAWLVLKISNVPSALAMVGVAWTVPQVVFLLWAGALTDRFDRRMVMIASDVMRGAAVCVIGLLALSETIQLWQVLVLVAIYGAGEGFFMPAFSAIVPDVVPTSQLVEANALDQFVRPVTLRFAGPAAGGLVITIAGPGTALLIDAITFLASAAAIAAISPHRPTQPSGERPSVWSDIKEGLSYVRGKAWLWISFLAAALGLLAFYGPFQVLVPYLVKNRLDGSAGDLGLVYAVGGMGAVLASILVSQWGLPKRHISFTFVCWGLGTLAMVGYAWGSSIWEVMLVTFVLEVFLTAGMIVYAALLQSHVPGSLLGRVSSVDWLISSSLIPLSYALTAPVSEGIGLKATFMGAGVLGGGAILLFLASPQLHEIESETKEPVPAGAA
ncbi:MAG: MFS transporter [Actinomycetota bacterium]|nr:MFS transporter [Actinomycetota bacterium]